MQRDADSTMNDLETSWHDAWHTGYWQRERAYNCDCRRHDPSKWNDANGDSNPKHAAASRGAAATVL